jgi:hypothetical protein
MPDLIGILFCGLLGACYSVCSYYSYCLEAELGFRNVEMRFKSNDVETELSMRYLNISSNYFTQPLHICLIKINHFPHRSNASEVVSMDHGRGKLLQMESNEASASL